MMNMNLMAVRTIKNSPKITSWFEKEIDFDMCSENYGKEETDTMMLNVLTEEGFPENTIVSDVDFDFIVMNKKDTKTLIVEYFEERTDLDRTASNEEIEQSISSESDVINFRLRNISELDIHVVVNDDLGDFMERHAYYDDNYFAKRMEESFDSNVLIPMIESREVMSLNQDYFIEKFRGAVRDENMPLEEFNYNDTPIKTVTIQLQEPFEAIAEQFSSKLNNYNTVTDYLKSEFYRDLLRYDKVYYQLELNVDIEAYGYE